MKSNLLYKLREKDLSVLITATGEVELEPKPLLERMVREEYVKCPEELRKKTAGRHPNNLVCNDAEKGRESLTRGHWHRRRGVGGGEG